MAGFVVAFRWRTSPGLPRDQWKRDSAQFAPSDTVGDLRRRLAPLCGSTAELAADNDPELWLCDEKEVLTQRVDALDILEWTPATCPRVLLERHYNSRRVAVLVFTFPPAAAPLPAPAAVAVRSCGARSRSLRAVLIPPPPSLSYLLFAFFRETCSRSWLASRP